MGSQPERDDELNTGHARLNPLLTVRPVPHHDNRRHRAKRHRRIASPPNPTLFLPLSLRTHTRAGRYSDPRTPMQVVIRLFFLYLAVKRQHGATCEGK